VKRLLLGMLLSVAAGASYAAPPGPRDPDWPCQQIKVPELSLAAVWSGPPVDPEQSTWKDDQQVVELVQTLAPRREPLDRAGDIIHGFAGQAGARKAPRLEQVLVGIYTVLDGERDSVIAGLDRFGRRQKQLAEGIRADNARLQALQTNTDADPHEVEQMTQRVKWEIEVFQDRRQAIQYACEAPARIEQRLFTLAHLIQHELD
jgi:hypothetical protein